MDGFEPNTGVLIIGATNKLQQLDEAFLRPGRFDRIIQVHLPDVKGREAILKIHTRYPVILAPEINLREIAKKMTGSSGAELANLVNEAALLAAQDETKTAITTEDFEKARDRVTLGNENKSLSSVMTESEKRVIAYHEAGHAIVAIQMPESDPIDKITIIPRGQTLGATSLISDRDRYNNTKSYLEELISILVAGRIAEEICLNKITVGAQNDIERLTAIAREMVMSFGMSELGLVNFKFSPENPLSEATRREVDLEIRQITKRAENRAREILMSRRNQLDRSAKALLERETIYREDIEKILKES